MGRRLVGLAIAVPIMLLINFLRTCSLPGPSTAPPSPPGNWRMAGHDARGTRRASVNGPTTAQLKWRVGQKSKFLHVGGYSSGLTCAQDGSIYGVNGSTLVCVGPDGKRKWSYSEWRKRRSLVYLSNTFAPALAADGTIYFAGDERFLYAFDQSGKRLWDKQIGKSSVQQAGMPWLWAPALADDGTLRIATNNTLFALAKDGQVLWEYTASSALEQTPAVAADGTTYVVSWEDAVVHAVDKQGRGKWTYDIGEYGRVCCSIGEDGTVYVGSASDGKVYALTPKGRLKWAVRTEGAFSSGPCIGPDGTIYIAGYDMKLNAISPAGQMKWTASFGQVDDGFILQPICDANGTVYVALNGGNVHKLDAIDRSGNTLWSYGFSTHLNLDHQPVITDTGHLVIGDDDGVLYCFGP